MKKGDDKSPFLISNFSVYFCWKTSFSGEKLERYNNNPVFNLHLPFQNRQKKSKMIESEYSDFDIGFVEKI